ncbi:MAG: tetraacyldisaccharide 4'-kinase [Sphingobacteriaceae bacterium]
MKRLRILLLPFSWLYALIVTIRNLAYDAGWFKQTSFTLPVIVIGNLDIGGAGKSPMTEYLIRKLKDRYRLATLSRGYGRKTTGYLVAASHATASEIGDEPAQFKQKFPAVTVAVCEKRVIGVERLRSDHELILLDDAFQHRAIKPGLSILLFDYSRIFEPHWLLPAGNLRERFCGRKRADVLVVSKCPENLDRDNQLRMIQRMAPFTHQSVFFSRICYGNLQHIAGQPGADAVIDAQTTVFILTGIANPDPLLKEIGRSTAHIIHHNYPDHHQFSLKNITKLVREFTALPSWKKMIITTEKDAQRLRDKLLFNDLRSMPVWVLPITIEFLNEEGDHFDQLIENYVRKHTTHHTLYSKPD